MSLSNLASLSSLKGFAGTLTGASTLALSLFFTSATVDSSGGVTDVDGTGNSLTYTSASDRTGLRRQYNADGVLEYAPHNLWPNSETWNSNGPGPVNITVSGNDLTITAAQGYEYGTSVAHSNLGLGGYTLKATVSCDVTQANVGFRVAGSFSGSIANQLVSFVAGEQQEIEFTFSNTNASNLFQFGVDNRTAIVSGATTDTGFTVTIHKVWVYRTPASGQYIQNTTSTPKYGPRVGTRNRKPVTNLLSYPEQFDNAAWTNSNTSESGVQSDPFGGTNAFKLTELDTAAGSTHYIETTTGITVQAKVYTHSVYAKAGERTWLRLGFATATGVAFFNLSTGTVGTTSGLDGYGIAPVEGATGWYRCWITDTLAAGTDKPRITIAEADNDVAYDGDGTSGLYIFGAQLNEGGIEDYVGATNLLTADKDFTTTWVNGSTSDTADTQVAPDGTTTADTITTTGTFACSVAQNKTLASAGSYTFSVFAKQGTAAFINLRPLGYDTSSAVWFNMATGAVGTQEAGVTGSSVYVGNGWYRFTVNFSTTSDLSGGLYVYLSDTNGSYSVTSGVTVHLWGAQLTKGSTLYPYVGMPQTGFTTQGYLAEAAATNLITSSEDMSSGWTISGTDSLTITANQSTGPDGLVTLDNLSVTDTTNEAHYLDFSVNYTANTNMVASAFVRDGSQSARYCSLVFRTSNENMAAAVFDTLAGTVTLTDVGTTSGTVNGAGVIPCGNGLHRIWLSFSVNENDATAFLSIQLNSAGTPTLAGTGLESYVGTAGDGVDVGGFQLETGTYPSSYIRTSGGTEIRAADVLKDTGLGWYTPGIGTFVATAQKDRTDYRGAIFSFGDITSISSTDISFDGQTGGKLRTYIQNNGAIGYSELTLADYKAGSQFKVAYGFEENNVNAAANGASAGTADPSCVIPTVNQFTIGAYRSTTTAESLHLNGFVKTIQYYSERKSDADLATLSTITDDGTSWRKEYA